MLYFLDLERLLVALASQHPCPSDGCLFVYCNAEICPDEVTNCLL